MAHVNQLIDHINLTLRNTYKDGVWVKALITQIAYDEREVLMIEGLDIDKFEKDKPEAKIVFRIMPKDQDGMLLHFSDYVDTLKSEGFAEIPKGELALYFKILPAIHWQGEFMPIVKGIGASDEEAKRQNLSSGLRIGIENSLLSLPDNNNKPWTNKDNADLERYFKEDSFGVNALAVAMRRTPISIVDQLMKLDLVTGSEGWRLRNKVIGRTT
jgi:hypothetical protein